MRRLITILLSLAWLEGAACAATAAGIGDNDKCEVLLLQQQRPSRLDLSGLGINTSGVSGSSYWFSAPKGITVKEFISASPDFVRKNLAKQLKVSGADRLERLLIDIEKPVSPRDFAQFRQRFGDDRFAALVAAFKMRIDVARELLPNVIIGVYGMPIPTSSRRDIFSLAKQVEGIQAAADLGLLDEVDEIYPTLYLRYGKSDRNYKARVEKMTKDGMASALLIRRSDGSAPGVVPLFGYRIYNGGSANHREIAPVDLARLQLKIARDTRGITTVAYWVENSSQDVRRWLERLQPKSELCNRAK